MKWGQLKPGQLKPGQWLILILILYGLLGTAYTLVVPLGEAPDEVDHFLYVRYLVEQRAFPVMQPIAAANETMEANQPPLFYLLNAAISGRLPQTASPDLLLNECYSFTPGQGRAHFYLHDWPEQDYLGDAYLAFRVARLVSVALGGLTVALAFVLARQMVPGQPAVWPLAAGLLAFNPQFIFITASVNNDVLMALLGAALVAVAVWASGLGGYGRFALLALLVGLGLLTKFALLAFWPLALLAVLANRYMLKLPARTGRAWLINFLLVIGLPVAVAGWWYGRNYRLYGDLLVWAVHLQAKGEQVLRTVPLVGADLLEFAWVHFQSYWGWFGWLKLPLPSWVYGLIAVLVLLAVVGLLLCIRPLLRWRQLSVAQLGLLFNLLAVAAIYASLFNYIQTINWSGYQGRLAFAAAGPMAALLAVGLARLVGERAAASRLAAYPMAQCFALSLALLPLLALFFVIRPAFARPELFWPDLALRRVCVDTAVGWQVEAADWEQRVRGNGRLPVTLYGLGLAQEEVVALDLVGFGGEVVATAETLLPATAGEPISQTVSLLVAADARPARGLLRLDGQDMGWVKIAPIRPFTPPAHMEPMQANFANQLVLVGYTVDETITLYWRAAGRITADYTTFIHLLDSEGNLIAQADGQPQQGWYPTSVWDVGELVADEKLLPLPEAGAGWRVVVGVYQLATGYRLPLVDGSGELVTLDIR